MSPSSTKSSTPVTVTVCGTFQFAAVNVNEAAETVPSVVSELDGADDMGTMCDQYGVWVEKSMYGKSYMGIERTTFLISKDGYIKRIWRKVKVDGHVKEVLEAAKAI